MADWKAISIGGVISAILTIILVLVFYPLFFIGPIIGGFLASYWSKSYEDYAQIDYKDGFIMGAMSGIIGGFILTLLLIIGSNAITNLIDFTSLNIGIFPGANSILAGYIILEFSLILCIIFGSVGGMLGVVLKSNDK